MRTRTLFGLAAILCAAVVFLAGCNKSTLAPGGDYAPVDSSGAATSAPDMSLFLVDSAYQMAYSAIDAVFTTERNNRQFLWGISPTIKHTIDGIRPQAVSANADYLKARAVYIANPVPANLAGVQEVLAKVQQLAVTAQAALPKGQ